MFYLSPRDKKTEKILDLGNNNPAFSHKVMPDALNAMFSSSKTYGLFTKYFDTELYNCVASNRGMSRKLAIVGIARVLEDVEISQRNHSLYQDVKRFLEQDFATIHKVSKAPDKFKPYITSRIDIKLMTLEGDFQILSLSDEKATLQKPVEFQNKGIGYKMSSYAGELNFTAKATVDGQIKLWLKGMWVPDPKDKSKLIPYWIDYTKLTVNDETIFDTLTPTWYLKPYSYTLNVKAGEEITVKVEWQPHRSDI